MTAWRSTFVTRSGGDRRRGGPGPHRRGSGQWDHWITSFQMLDTPSS